MSVWLLATALFFTLRYLPGVGGRDHSRYDFSLKILAPLVAAVLTFLAFDSLYYVGRTYVDESRLAPVIVWTLVPCAAAWLLLLLTRGGSARERLSLLFGPLSLAVSAMAAGTGVATWAVTNFVLWNPNPDSDRSWAAYVTVGPPAVLLGFALGTVLFVGLSSRFLKDEDREWMSRAVGTILLFCAGWTGVCAMVLLLPHWALAVADVGPRRACPAGAASAWLSTFGGSRSPARAASPTGRRTLLSLAAKLAPAVFLALLAGALSVLTNFILFAAHLLILPLTGAQGAAIDWTDHYGMLTRTSPTLLGRGAGLCRHERADGALHQHQHVLAPRHVPRPPGPRLSRRLEQRRAGPAGSPASPRTTTCRCTRSIPAEAVPRAEPRAEPRRRQPARMAAAQGGVIHRHRIACGSRDLGYRPSSEYGGGITLGTAVAISGAAASPNMGYHSSAVVGFIMTLFNARLGSWLGNPGPPGERTWQDPGPLSAVRSMVKEALGQTSDQSEYVYLSDGGHFENLGTLRDGAPPLPLHRRARRRLRSRLPLRRPGNALRKIRIDIRIPIDFDEAAHHARSAAGSSAVRRHDSLLGRRRPRHGRTAGLHQAGAAWHRRPRRRELCCGSPGRSRTRAPATSGSTNRRPRATASLGLHTVDEMCRGWAAAALPTCAVISRWRISVPELGKRLKVASSPLPSCSVNSR